MSEERETTIAILAGVVDLAQQRYTCIGMLNIAHLDAEGRARLTIEYENARTELDKAQEILREAILTPI